MGKRFPPRAPSPSRMKLQKENLNKTTAQAFTYNNGGSGSNCLLLCLKC